LVYDATTEFDPTREYILLMHEIDPGLHAAVERGEAYDIRTKHDRYWTINGRSFPDNVSNNNVEWLPNQPYSALVEIEAFDPASGPLPPPALIRYANAGLEAHPFHPHGNHMELVGRDGRRYDERRANFTTTLGPGQSYDMFFRWLDVDAWDENLQPIPVNLPGNYNLVYKDGVTFFSNDAYLGAKEDLPVGTTSYNQCGEFYFPWHSHALNEVQNFDEGFGGQLTLVRVNPPGGCP
jgi:hypothetical protein